MIKHLAAGIFALAILATGAHAQTETGIPRNVVHLTANASVAVENDWLTMTLGTTTQGATAQAAQDALKKDTTAALEVTNSVIKSTTRANSYRDALRVRTRDFDVRPLYDNDSKITGWAGRAEIVLEGREFALISETASKITTMAITGTAFSLSRDLRASQEARLYSLAIERFKTLSKGITKDFGFDSFSLGEINMSTGETGTPIYPRMMMKAASAGPSTPMPVEAGKGTLQATVSGSILMK